MINKISLKIEKSEGIFLFEKSLRGDNFFLLIFFKRLPFLEDQLLMVIKLIIIIFHIEP